MNSSHETKAAARRLVGSSLDRALEQARRHDKRLHRLVQELRIPSVGWTDDSIEALIQQMVALDSNNFQGRVGVGEREARIWSSLVSRRHWYAGHGIGRSGDVGAPQPKAVGSSLIVQLTREMMVDLLHRAGMKPIETCLVLPVATGMAMMITYLALRSQRGCRARYVIWPRIDQKTCLKAIVSSGLVPLIVENKLEGDELRTDLDALRASIERVGSDTVLCVCSTSTCFAPRAPDRLEDIARVCKEFGIPHVVNNAYGVQCPLTCDNVAKAMRRGRIDVVIQSTDKNFMVPVGGAVVAGYSSIIDEISRTYPGRASISPIMDLFVTMLSMGFDSFEVLRQRRRHLFQVFRDKLGAFAAEIGERLLLSENNTISVAMTLSTFRVNSELCPTYLGSMIYSRNSTGARVVDPELSKTVVGSEFQSYGAHFDGYMVPYLACACAIGMLEGEVDFFIETLRRCTTQFRRQAVKVSLKE